MKSLAGILIAKLEIIVELFDRLIAASTIDFDPNKIERMSREFGVSILAFVPDSSWGAANDLQRALQRQLMDLWGPWLAQVSLLFSLDTTTRKNEIQAAAKRVHAWIERDQQDFTVPATIERAHEVIRDHVAPLFRALRELDSGSQDVLVFPDTNVILRSQDVGKYRETVGADAFVVVLVPGVLAELDEHKINHRNEVVRERARRFSSRIKGWRAQGDLVQGVRVEGNVFIRVEGREPDLSKALPWLDSDVKDDRILASILELQRRHPSARCVLLTGDSVMLAKADAASVPTADTPEPDV